MENLRDGAAVAIFGALFLWLYLYLEPATLAVLGVVR